MSITIEPTAEAIFQALQQLPAPEIERFHQLFQGTPIVGAMDDSSEWDDEDLRDLDLQTARLIDERFGPETENYD